MSNKFYQMIIKNSFKVINILNLLYNNNLIEIVLFKMIYNQFKINQNKI